MWAKTAKARRRERRSKRHLEVTSRHMEVRGLFGRFVWRGINFYDVTIHPSRGSRINSTLKVWEHNQVAHASPVKCSYYYQNRWAICSSHWFASSNQFIVKQNKIYLQFCFVFCVSWFFPDIVIAWFTKFLKNLQNRGQESAVKKFGFESIFLHNAWLELNLVFFF